MKTLQERFIFQTRHLQRDASYLVGLSGGRDSVVLLHLLETAGFSNLTICHFNHRTRKTAESDAEFAASLAIRSNKRIIIDTNGASNAVQLSESALRELRMNFFGKATRDTQAAGIFLGHQADDQAETFLWNLLRGAGGAGLSGMQAESIVATDAGPIRLLRPMLDFWREDIDRYIAHHRLEFVEDPSNRSRKYTRNRLRHDILPWLEDKLGRSVRANLHRSATILSEENQLLTTLAAEFDAGNLTLDVRKLQAAPPALQRRRILAWLQHHAIAEAGFDEVELIRSMLDVENGPSRINLPRDRQARRRAGQITLARQSD